MVQNMIEYNDVETITIEEASLRLVKYAEKLSKIVCKEKPIELGKNFLKHFTALSRNQANEKARAIHDDFTESHVSAVTGYHPTGTIEKHMALVLNALDMTYHEKRPRVKVQPRKNGLVSSESNDKYVRAVTSNTIEFFENENCFCAMLGNKNADNLVSVMTEFGQGMPVKPAAPVYETNAKKKPVAYSLLSALSRTLNLG
jgi:hypothetical protein